MSALTIHNPATGTVLRELPADDAASVVTKAAAARRAQKAWAARPFAERKAIIQRFRDLLAERKDTLALTQSAETGKPISQARGEIGATPGRIDFFLDHVAAEMQPRLMRQDPEGSPVPGTAAMEEAVTFDPLGVIANISAWNYPWFVGTNVYVPALLTGSAVLYKPSEFATLTGLAMADLLYEAGVPADVFQCLVGGGDVGAALLEQPIDGVFFTGSHGTGHKVMMAAARRMIPCQLELGGKDPVYIADDVADVAAVAAGIADGAFYNNGQSCCAVERIYVHERIADAFRAGFVSTVKDFVMGDPSDNDTYLGSLTRPAQIEVLEDQIQDALDKGATVLIGGKRADRPGAYFEPTVLWDVNHQMKVMWDETFGPVIGIQTVKSDEEAAEMMADTVYGLTASVYSADRGRAASILAKVPSGTSYWNCCDRVSPYLPWSGRGHSGLGSTLSLEGIRCFLRPRAWHLRAP